MSIFDIALASTIVALLFTLWAVRDGWVKEAASQYEEAEELTDLLHEVWGRTHIFWHEQHELEHDEWAAAAVNAMQDIEQALLESRFDPELESLYGECDVDRELAFMDEDDD